VSDRFAFTSTPPTKLFDASTFSATQKSAPLVLANNSLNVNHAQHLYDFARNNMPGRNGFDSAIAGVLNDLSQPFSQFFNRLGFTHEVPKNCSEQALYMADQFHRHGYPTSIHYSRGHAWFSVEINGTRYYGDTWQGWTNLDTKEPDKAEGGYRLQ
jgi:hypothetical protein